jgi:hypothetical protein
MDFSSSGLLLKVGKMIKKDKHQLLQLLRFNKHRTIFCWAIKALSGDKKIVHQNESQTINKGKYNPKYKMKSGQQPKYFTKTSTEKTRVWTHKPISRQSTTLFGVLRPKI